MQKVNVFPARLRRFRKQYDYKIRDVAKLMNVSAPTISSYELGTREPSLSALVQLAKLYHCTTDYLLGVDEKQPEIDDVAIGIRVMQQRLKELEQMVAAR